MDAEQRGLRRNPVRGPDINIGRKLNIDAKKPSGGGSVAQGRGITAPAFNELRPLEQKALDLLANGISSSFIGRPADSLDHESAGYSHPSGNQEGRLDFHRLFAAFLAISCRLASDSLSARTFPPIFPPLARLGAIPLVSSISPVAIRPTMTAAPITSAGRFSPRGPRGIRFALQRDYRGFRLSPNRYVRKAPAKPERIAHAPVL